MGFPGEDESAFGNTLRLMRRAGIGRAHVFPYSPRRGTPAASFEGRVDPAALSARAAEAAALGNELLDAYAGRFIGRTLPVLAEGGRCGGYTPHFLPAVWEGEAEVARSVRLHIDSASGGELRGCPV